MSPQIIECIQGEPEWFQARLGIPTASMFATVMASGRGGGESKTRRDYLLKLAGEILTGEPMPNYVSADMERGKVMEDEARDCYALITDTEPERVGFIRNGDVGCSPDALIVGDGMLEIKTAQTHILLDKLLRDEFPPEHKAQCQGALWVAEREWIDLAIYWPGLPLFIKRAYREESYITHLAGTVDAFNAELQSVVAKIRSWKERKAA